MTLDEITERIDSGCNIVVRCDTKEKAIKLLTLYKDKGYRWCNGEVILDKNTVDAWNAYRADTMYYVRANKQKSVMYGNYDARYPEMYYNKECALSIMMMGYEYLYVEYEDETDVIEKSDMTLESLMNITN